MSFEDREIIYTNDIQSYERIFVKKRKRKEFNITFRCRHCEKPFEILEGDIPPSALIKCKNCKGELQILDRQDMCEDIMNDWDLKESIKKKREENPMYPYIGPTFDNATNQRDRIMARVYENYFIGAMQGLGLGTFIECLDKEDIAIEVLKYIKEKHPNIIGGIT